MLVITVHVVYHALTKARGIKREWKFIEILEYSLLIQRMAQLWCFIALVV